MTVRAILSAKGPQVASVEPDVKLSAAVKILSERQIGSVLVLSGTRIDGILSERDIVRALDKRGAVALDEPVNLTEWDSLILNQANGAQFPGANEISNGRL